MRRLDVDLCPLWEKQEKHWTEKDKYVFKLLKERRPHNKWGSAFKSADNYVNDQQSGWEDLYDEIQEFMDMKEDFPSKRGKDFDGFPVHFSTSDRDEMRKLLMQLPGYTLILEDERDETAFFVHCKMWGLL